MTALTPRMDMSHHQTFAKTCQVIESNENPMKRTILLAISILLILSACSSPKPIPTATATASITASPTHGFVTSTPKPTNTPSPVEEGESWDEIKPFLDNILGGQVISPNGQWIIEKYYADPKTKLNKIISIDNPNLSLNITYDLPEPTPYGYSFESWAPNSTGLAAMYFGPTTSGWDYCCGQSIVVSNINNGEIESHLFSWGWFEKPNVYWSSDSSNIGLAFRDKGFWILDRQGNLIRKVPLNDITSLIWLEDNIYAINYTRNQQDMGDDCNLYKVNPNSDSIDQIYTFKQGVHVFGFDKNSNQLLAASYYPQLKLVLFNLATKEIKEIDFPDKASYFISSPSMQFMAIYTGDHGLWIFDLAKQSFQYYGKIAKDEYGKPNSILGWFSNINGFLVIAQNSDPKIVRP